MNDRVFSIGMIASEANASIPATRRVIDKLGVRESGRVGTNRFFDEPAVRRVVKELADIKARRLERQAKGAENEVARAQH
jgi:hypothetical protein